MGGKLQKFIKMFQVTMLQKWWWHAKKAHHHETQEFNLELKYKVCDYDYIKRMVWGSWQYCLWSNWSKSLDLKWNQDMW